jgi:serine/threonine protein kinase
MKKVLRMFGRYLLLDHLAQGGMAEIFRAWAPSVDDGGRLIVLKCVQPDFGQDAEFLQMFRSEIRVSIGLNHPNIVQLYDFGEAEGRPYIAMELVEGRSLKQIIQHLVKFDKLLPVEFAAFAIEQVAAGLQYAHSFRDRTTGEALSIVHRDISPQNLLVSFAGNMKIIDFGIAKAASNRQTTRAGIIKGKPSYLSPEQINGDVLDGRSDVFSLGAVFWEALTGRKLFSGESDLAAIKLIDNCDDHVTPPSTLNPDVPSEIDAIIMKCLVYDREKRYRTAEELQRAIHRAIYAFKPSFDPSDFGKYLSETFAREIEQEQKDLQVLNAQAKNLIRENLERVPSLDVKERFDSEESPADGNDSQTTARDADATSISDVISMPSASSSTVSPPRPESSGARFYQVNNAETVDLEPHKVKKKHAFYPSSSSEEDEAPSKVPHIIAGLIALTALGYYLFGQPKSPNHQQPQQPVQQQTASHDVSPTTVVPPPEPKITTPVSTTFATLKLDLMPSGGSVDLRINGRRVNSDRQVQLPLKAPLEFRVEKPGFKAAVRDVTLTQTGDYPLQINLEPERSGLLTLRTTPSANVVLKKNDLTWTLASPIERMKLPPGLYEAHLVNAFLGLEKKVSFEILADKVITEEVDLSVK